MNFWVQFKKWKILCHNKQTQQQTVLCRNTFNPWRTRKTWRSTSGNFKLLHKTLDMGQISLEWKVLPAVPLVETLWTPFIIQSYKAGEAGEAEKALEELKKKYWAHTYEENTKFRQTSSVKQILLKIQKLNGLCVCWSSKYEF